MARRVKKPLRAVPREAPNGEEIETSEMPFAEGAHDELDPDLRHRMISEAAYSLYAQRGYADGYDFDDWLQAEAEVDHMLLKREPEQVRAQVVNQ